MSPSSVHLHHLHVVDPIVIIIDSSPTHLISLFRPDTRGSLAFDDSQYERTLARLMVDSWQDELENAAVPHAVAHFRHLNETRKPALHLYQCPSSAQHLQKNPDGFKLKSPAAETGFFAYPKCGM